MPDSTLLVLTRAAAAPEPVREAVLQAQKRHDLTVRIPWDPAQTRAEIRQAAEQGTRRVIAGCGDGTLNLAVSALLDLGLADHIELGLLPLGTANDFARACGDDGQDLGASLDRALIGQARATDLGEINGQPFANVASGGLGAMVTATTPGDMKAQLGGLAYTLHGLSRLADLEPVRCRFELDGAEELEAPLSFLAIGNCRYAGGGFDVAPDARPDDGFLDLALISHDWTGVPGLPVREFLDPTNRRNEVMVCRRFRNCRKRSEKAFHLNLDGEPMEADDFEISVRPGAIRMVR